jgi:phage internal scaffolding protein
MSKIKEFVRTPHNYDVDEASNESGISCPEPTLAQQHCKDECDINYIVERFGVTGQLPPQTGPMPTYGDFTGIGDYRDALEAVRAADDAFMALPAKVREKFDNDPALFVDFCSSTDPEDRSLAIELGLIPPPAKPDGVIPSPDGVANPEPKA